MSLWDGLVVDDVGFRVNVGHGSFFESQRANNLLGIITGILTFTPYYRWKHDHAVHHATSGDLDRRGRGDVYTMTVQEYLDAPWWKKAGYRVMRNPFALLLIGPMLVFVVTERIPPPRRGGARSPVSGGRISPSPSSSR